MKTPRRELRETERTAAAKLRELWEKKQREYKSKTGKKLAQASASFELGFSSPSAFSQYIQGNIPLNVKQLLNFASYFNVQPDEIFPELAATIGEYRYRLNDEKSELVLVSSTLTPYTLSGDEKLMIEATEFIFEVVGLDVARHRGAQWTAQALLRLHDLFGDPASKDLNKDTILKLIA